MLWIQKIRFFFNNYLRVLTFLNSICKNKFKKGVTFFSFIRFLILVSYTMVSALHCGFTITVITICLPSIASQQLKKFHSLSKLLATRYQSSRFIVDGDTRGWSMFQRMLHVSFIVFGIDDKPTQLLKWAEPMQSPVAE